MSKQNDKMMERPKLNLVFVDGIRGKHWKCATYYTLNPLFHFPLNCPLMLQSNHNAIDITFMDALIGI